jgi:predicted membrane chloride channel (bestrophin family)
MIVYIAKTVVLSLTARGELWTGSGAYQSLNFVVGFMVIYRAQQAYARYWQGRMALCRMSAYWGSAFIHACSFAKHAPHRAPMETHEDLAHALLKRHDTLVGKMDHSPDDWMAHGKLVVTRVIRRILPQPHAHAFDSWREITHAESVKKLRARKLMMKLQMKREKGCFETWQEFVKQNNSHRFFDDVMHLSSLLHATACMMLRCDYQFKNLVPFNADDVACNSPSPGWIYIDQSAEGRGKRDYVNGTYTDRIWRTFFGDGDGKHERYCECVKLGVIYGVSDEERESLERSHDPCHTVLCWVTSMVARRYSTEVFVAPPITSRIFHELNQGHMSFLEALAVTSTPYPLPLAQMTNTVVMLFSLVFGPIQFSATVENPFWASAYAFLCTMLFYGISECARELEDPFVSHPNDLPVAFLHAQLNLGLVDMVKEPWPHRNIHEDKHMKAKAEATRKKQARVLLEQQTHSTSQWRAYVNQTYTDDDEIRQDNSVYVAQAQKGTEGGEREESPIQLPGQVEDTEEGGGCGVYSKEVTHTRDEVENGQLDAHTHMTTEFGVEGTKPATTAR